MDENSIKDSLKGLKTLQILEYYEAIMDELTERQVLRTYNNPVAGYSEYLVCKTLSLTAARNSEMGFDAVDENGIKYEIKSRRNEKESSPTRFSPIRDISGHHFDFLIAIIFHSNFQVKQAIKIPYELVKEKAKYRKSVNGWVLPVRGLYWNDDTATDLTEKFITAQKQEIN